MKHDIKIAYRCDRTYRVYAQPNPSSFTEDEYLELGVDKDTCEPESEDYLNKIAQKSQDDKKQEVKREWGNLEFILLSLMVPSSFLAGYNPTTFYSGIVYLAATPLRGIFIFYTYTAYQYELTNPDPIVKIIEACYMYRHEENLIAEEESYRML